MEKIFLIALIVLLAAAGVVAAMFGFLQLEHLVYVMKLMAGWTAWTIFVALVYAGCERLFPNVLCPPATEDS